MANTQQAHFRCIKVLSDEVDASSSLFHHGFRILANYKFATTDADPLFVCLAGGGEKLLKLTLGLHGLDVDGAWPSASVMQGAGHRITNLNTQVRTLIQDSLSKSTVPGYVQQLLSDHSQDPYITQILEILERYAVNGRFYNLDYLGDRPQPQTSPGELWEELHQTILQMKPELLARTDQAGWEKSRKEINQTIEASIRLWCELIARSWMTGLFGDQAKTWSFQLGLHKR